MYIKNEKLQVNIKQKGSKLSFKMRFPINIKAECQAL